MVYADIMTISSTALVFAAYGTAALILDRTFSLKRVLAVSLLLSLISTIIVLRLPPMASPVTGVVLIALGVPLCFGRLPLREIFRLTITTLALALTVGGLRLVTAPLPWIIPVSLMYGGILLFRKKLHSAITIPKKIYRLEIHRGSCQLILRGLCDTGHSLTYRGQGIIIGESSALRELYLSPQEDLRLIPYKAVGGEQGIIIGIRCDYVLIDSIKKENIIVGAVDTSLSEGLYNALIPPEMTG